MVSDGFQELVEAGVAEVGFDHEGDLGVEFVFWVEGDYFW